MSKPKIGLHVAANCGGCGGISGYWAALDAAGVPFVVYSANDAGLLARAAVFGRAILVYRDVEASTVNPADYARPTAEMAGYYWQRTMERLPAAVHALRGRVWLELLNEPGREPAQARWVGALMAGMARLALADGWRVCGPGWAPGNPEPEAWLTPEWTDYLRLCASQPGRVAVSVHEYALSDDIGAGWGWLVGRFRFVHEAADRAGLRRPMIFISEAGWTLNSMPPDDQAKRDIERMARLYAEHANIAGANLWTLQAGAGNGNLPTRLNALMGWLTNWTIATELPDAAEPPPPDNGGEPMPTNLLSNGSFEDGWTDATTFPGQHPKGWTVEWNTGPVGNGYDYGIGEAVHKSGQHLPENERGAFIWDGEWTLKVFAGNRAIWPRLKQTLALPAGRYRLTTPVWTDCYHWNSGKDYNLDPQHLRWVVKVNGVEVANRALVAGRRESPFVEFDHSGGALALAVHFQCRWPIASNNLWLDGWTLAAVPVTPPPPPPPPVETRHKAIVVKLPQSMTAAEWRQAADYSFQFRHTMTASHDDMLTILNGGNAQSYVKLAFPERQQDVAALVEAAGYTWQPILAEVTPPFVSTPTP